MKTISGQIVSTKQISLSKASKILSKFVSAENGATQAINAYLHRASSAFNELNHIHKELKSSSSNRKHKKHKTKDADQDSEKSSHTVSKSSQPPNGSIQSHAGNEGGSEKQKNKKKQHEVEYREHGDLRVEFGHEEGEPKVSTIETKNEIKPSRVQGREAEGYAGVEEEKKQKKEKNKGKKDKEGGLHFSSSKSKIENPESKNAMGSKHRKERKKNLGNNVEGENGGLVDPVEIQIKKNKNEAATENGLYSEEVNMMQKKKRKSEHEEDRSGYVSNKRMKRKHEGDS